MSDIKNFVAMESDLDKYVEDKVTSLLSEGGVSKICMKNDDYNSVLFDGTNGSVQAKSIQCWDSTNITRVNIWSNTDNNSGQLALFKGDGTRSIYMNGESGGMSLAGNLAVAGVIKPYTSGRALQITRFDGTTGIPCTSNHNVKFECDGAHMQLYVDNYKIGQLI